MGPTMMGIGKMYIIYIHIYGDMGVYIYDICMCFYLISNIMASFLKYFGYLNGIYTKIHVGFLPSKVPADCQDDSVWMIDP